MMNASLRQLRSPCWSIRSPVASRPSCSLRSPTFSLSTEQRTRFATTRATPNDNPSSVTEASSSVSNDPPSEPLKAKEVTDADWESEVMKSDVVVFVDFWAPWCGPCRMLAPTIDEIIDYFGDKVKAVKLNTDQSPGVASKYGIRSIPTVMIFKQGEKKDSVIGNVGKTALKNLIEKYL